MTLQNSVDKSKIIFYLTYGKRIFDLALAITALILLSPVLVVAALLVHVQLGTPVLFKQRRPGLHEKPFTIFKFRTMSDARDKNGELLPDAERLKSLTPLGAFLRKSSIDELPELINVLVGDMSFVGPRPLLMEHLQYYTERERLRYTVRPGITGLSQVSGRNYLPWDDRLEMDVQYVENISFFRDIKIIFQTFFQVLRAKNVIVVPGPIGVPLSKSRQQLKENKTNSINTGAK
jgi:lipopolysaccharide/colanic/teichoic acid biosynthesis glycosyltransferase